MELLLLSGVYLAGASPVEWHFHQHEQQQGARTNCVWESAIPQHTQYIYKKNRNYATLIANADWLISIIIFDHHQVLILFFMYFSQPWLHTGRIPSPRQYNLPGKCLAIFDLQQRTNQLLAERGEQHSWLPGHVGPPRCENLFSILCQLQNPPWRSVRCEKCKKTVTTL